MPKTAQEAAVLFGAYVHFERLETAFAKVKGLNQEVLLRVIRSMSDDERADIVAMCVDMTEHLSRIEAALKARGE